jgi:hypothetical protein
MAQQAYQPDTTTFEVSSEGAHHHVSINTITLPVFYKIIHPE